MKYDDILNIVGPFGTYQKLIVFLVLQPALFPCGFLGLNAVYMAATPADYWCKLPVSNLSSEEVKALLPREEHDGRMRHSQCKMFQLNYTDLSDTAMHINLTQMNLAVIPCQHGWDYDRSVYQSTLVTEYDLVCTKGLLPATSFSIYAIGGFTGPLLFGFLADKIGRRPTYFVLVFLLSVFSVATYFSNGFIWFCVCRFFIGSTTSFSYSIPFLMSIELTGSSTRVWMSVICSAGYSISVMIMAGLAHPFRDWRTLSLVSTAPVLCLFLLWKFFPESPRWLLARGRYEEVEAFLRMVSKVNNRPLPKHVDENLSKFLRKVDKEDHTKTHSILDLFRTPNMRKKTLILVFLNFCNAGIFVGLNYYAPAFGKDPHLNSFLSALIELPPLILAALFCDRFGRRLCLVGGMMLGAISSLTSCAVPETETTALTALSLFSKLWITLTFMIGELVEEEIFPTVVRGEGHSITSFLGNTAAVMSPFIVYLGHSLLVLPLAIFGTSCLIIGFFSLFLPETTGSDLPQTLQDGEDFGKNMTWKDIFSFTIPKESNSDLLTDDDCDVKNDEKEHQILMKDDEIK